MLPHVKLLWLSVAGALLVVGATPAWAAVLTFDDLPNPGDGIVPNGYGGLNWNNFYYLDGVNFSYNPSGYQAGVVSPNNVAVNGFGDPATIVINSAATFTFTGAYLTAAWNDGLSVQVQGFANDVLQYDTTVNPSATAPTFFMFNYENVDRLRFASFGGTHHAGYTSYGEHFAMDNFTFEVIPEPGTGLLVIAGLLGLGGWRRARD
jgi:hypothetical protein